MQPAHRQAVDVAAVAQRIAPVAAFFGEAHALVQRDGALVVRLHIELDAQHAAELARRCEDAALRTDKRITNSEGAGVSAQQAHFWAGNTRGFRGGYASSRHYVSVSPIAGRGKAMQRDAWYSSMRDARELAAPEAVGRYAAERALSRLKSRKVATCAVPVLFEPMVLENRGGCAPPLLPQPGKDSPQLQQVVEGLRGYADKQQRRYIHLADGGLTDNLGLRAFQETIDLAGGLRPFLRKIDREPNGHVMVVSVDASGNAAAGLGLGLRAPSMLQAIDVMSDVQLHRYNAATLEQMHDSLQRWAREVSTPQRTVQPWLVKVSLRDIPDPAERTRLSKVTTSFDLKPEEVDALVAAGRALLRDNPEFRRVRAQLGDPAAK